MAQPWMKWWVGVFPSPKTLDDIKPELTVYRRSKQEITVKHNENPADVMAPKGFLDAKKLVFLVHGFRNADNEPWIQDMKNALVEAEDQTVVVVSWGGGTNLNPWDYCQASSNTRTIGSWVGDCAKRIKDKKPSIYLHGIGHSLGAHVLGMAGRESGKFDRISGLDPAGPEFDPGSSGYKNGLRSLCDKDAKMVDVIHTCCYTNMDVAIGPYHYGRFEPMGTVDFYPNYGYMQPGTLDKQDGSHQRAHEIFLWSIKNPGELWTNQELTEVPSKGNLTPKHIAVAPVEMGYHADSLGKKPAGLYYIGIMAEALDIYDEIWKHDTYRLVRNVGTQPPDAALFGHHNDGMGATSLAVAHTKYGSIPAMAKGDTCWYGYADVEEKTDRFSWITAKGSRLSLLENDGSGPPPLAVLEGVETVRPNGIEQLFSAVAFTEWGSIPGKAFGNCCWYTHDGKEYNTSSFSWVYVA